MRKTKIVRITTKELYYGDKYGVMGEVLKRKCMDKKRKNVPKNLHFSKNPLDYFIAPSEMAKSLVL